ncbi:putative ribonuclease H-like domain-containing protein [Tanacetum coccineum]
MVPRAVLMKSGLVSLNTTRQVNIAHSKTTVNVARPMSYLFKKAHSTVKRPIHKNTAFKNNNFNQRVNTIKDKNVNAARPKAVVNAARPKAVVNVVQGNNVNAIKTSACLVWKPKTKVLDHGNPYMDLQDKGVIDSGCSRHMIGDMSYLTEYEEIDGGYVAFGGNPKGGKITGKASDNAGQARKETEPVNDYILLQLWTADPPFSQGPKSSQDDRPKSLSDDGKKVDENPRKECECNDQEKEDNVNSTKNVNATSTNEVNVVGGKTNIELPDDPNMPALEDCSIFNLSRDDEDVGAEADMNNLDTTIQVSPIPTTRIHKYHPLDQVIGDLQSATQTRRMSKNLEEQEPKKVIYALKDPSWIEAMQEELLQFKLQEVWTLVDLPNGKRAIDTKWVFRNKKDERGIVIRNKARLVAQGNIQEEEIDYDKVFVPVARIKAIKLFLAYASFKDFVVYEMDVKSAFLYGKIKEEVYVCQPPGFEDLDFPDRVYKVEKAPYRLHQAPRAWYETLSTNLMDTEFQRGKINKTLFIKSHKGDILLVQVYVDDIIFGSTKKELCTAFEKLMHEKFQMSSMGELTFFLGLQVQQKKDGIFVSQDKYVGEILKKFGFTEVKTASTPMETQKPLLKDEDGEEVYGHMYRSIIGSLMYLTSSRPDIMFAVCACARYQVNLKVLHLHAMKRIFSMVVFWSKPAECEGFEQIVDFLNVNPIRYALTINPTISTSCIEQFWATVKAKTVNGEQLKGMATHDSIYVTPSHTKKIFRNMRRVGKGFSGRETPLFQTIVVQDQAEMGEGSANPTDLHHTLIIIEPSISQPQKKQKARKPKRKDTEIPLSSGPIDNVADKAVNEEMDDSLERAATIATSLDAEQDRGNINKTQSKATLNEPSSPGTSLGSGPRRQETMGVTIAQTSFENISKHSNDPLLVRGNTLQSREDILKLKELMALCTTLQSRVLALETTKTSQAKEIVSLKRRVKKLEKRNNSRTHGLKRLYRVSLSRRVESSEDEGLGEEDASKQGRIADIDANKDIYLVNVQTNEDMFGVNDLEGDEVIVESVDVVKIAEETRSVVEEVTAVTIPVSAAITTTTTTAITDVEMTLAQALAELKSAKPKADKVVIQEPEQGTTTLTLTTITAATTITAVSIRPRAKGLTGEDMFGVNDLDGDDVIVESVDVVNTAKGGYLLKRRKVLVVPGVPKRNLSRNDKGKGKMVEQEPVKKMSKKDLLRLDEELAFKLQAEEEEERLTREKAQQVEEANIAWDEVQAKTEAAYQLDQRQQAQEQEELTDAKKARLFVQFLEQRRKIFTAKRA